jgi:hypothetical protein
MTALTAQPHDPLQMEWLIALSLALGVAVLVIGPLRPSRPSPGGVKRGLADPLAEAEVYLAYGQRQKAIDVLEAASRSHPERTDFTKKLNELRTGKVPLEPPSYP